jgi:hypothetical protein
VVFFESIENLTVYIGFDIYVTNEFIEIMEIARYLKNLRLILNGYYLSNKDYIVFF